MAIFGREIILFAAEDSESQRSLRVREQKDRDAGENSETAKVVKNREPRFGGMDSGVFTGYLSRQILKAEVQDGNAERVNGMCMWPVSEKEWRS